MRRLRGVRPGVGTHGRAVRVPFVTALLLVAMPASAGYSSASPRGRASTRCDAADCALPMSAIAFGGTSAAYLGAWMWRSGELPFGVHVGGAFVGGLSTVTAILYAGTNEPAPKYQTFGAVACLAVGVPSMLLGVHGLVTAESDRDEQDPGPVPNWYGPSYAVDVRGRMAPSFAFGGVF